MASRIQSPEAAVLLIPCPFCGERDETEFRCGGEAHIVRPKQPAALSDDQWADYLFMRSNPKGVHFERWRHIHGCGRWFNLARDTVSDRILQVYAIGTPRPRLEALAAKPLRGRRPDLSLVDADEP
jgi:heterotetrameric sarcosine oxidase delta subunit